MRNARVADEGQLWTAGWGEKNRMEIKKRKDWQRKTRGV
jgi:hypothetical protein